MSPEPDELSTQWHPAPAYFDDVAPQLYAIAAAQPQQQVAVPRDPQVALVEVVRPRPSLGPRHDAGGCANSGRDAGGRLGLAVAAILYEAGEH
eukprot:COSAG01_NODE_33078_length_570_cov_1.401274_1_plen_93_part_00